MIYVIGDSHSCALSGHGMNPAYPILTSRNLSINARLLIEYKLSRKHKLEGFKTYRIGAATAHNIEKHLPVIFSILKFKNLRPEDTLALSFGEIDIRNHLIRMHDVDLGLNKTITNYINGLKKLANKYGCKILILGSIASWLEGYEGPSAGSNLERNKLTENFNLKLKTQAQQNGFYYLDFFYEMLDQNFKTKQAFLDTWPGSRMHLNPKFGHLYAEKIRLILNVH